MSKWTYYKNTVQDFNVFKGLHHMLLRKKKQMYIIC